MFIFYRIACNYFFILTIFILTVHGLQFSRTRRESKSRYWARNAALFDDLFTNHFCRGWGIFALGGAGMGKLPFRLSAWFWAGLCSAGRVGGQVTQSGSTRIPSPAVAVVAAVGCTYRAGSVDHWHGILGKIDKLRGIPEGMRYRSGVATSSEHQIVAWR